MKLYIHYQPFAGFFVRDEDYNVHRIGPVLVFFDGEHEKTLNIEGVESATLELNCKADKLKVHRKQKVYDHPYVLSNSSCDELHIPVSALDFKQGEDEVDYLWGDYEVTYHTYRLEGDFKARSYFSNYKADEKGMKFKVEAKRERTEKKIARDTLMADIKKKCGETIDISDYDLQRILEHFVITPKLEP